MGEVHKVPRRPEPESICTRVVARVIEELSCIEIAPDSPSWSDLTCAGSKVGQLAVYRGRSGVRRMVSFDVRVEHPWLDAHCVAVLTDARSLVPHLLVSAWSDGGGARIHADLLPRAPLDSCSTYAECCFAPLSAARDKARSVAALRPVQRGEAQRRWGSPWGLAWTATPDALAAAAECIDAYTDHWGRLMRKGTPFAAQCDAQAALQGERYDLALRTHVFAREADPMWSPLENALGNDSVAMLLRALRDEA